MSHKQYIRLFRLLWVIGTVGILILLVGLVLN